MALVRGSPKPSGRLGPVGFQARPVGIGYGEVVLRAHHSLLRGRTIQPRGLRQVDLEPRLSLAVHSGKVVKGGGLPLTCRHAVPLQRLEGVRLRHALPVVIHQADVVLADRIALPGRRPKPPERLGIVLRQPQPLVVGHRDDVLRDRISPPRRLTSPVDHRADLFRGRAQHGRHQFGGRGVRLCPGQLRVLLRCSAIRPGNLVVVVDGRVAGHAEFAEQVAGRVVTGIRGDSEPPLGVGIVVHVHVTVRVHHAEHHRCVFVATVRGRAVPPGGLFEVQPHSCALVVRVGQAGLGTGVALLGGGPHPLDALLGIIRNAVPRKVHGPKPELRLGNALPGEEEGPRVGPAPGTPLAAFLASFSFAGHGQGGNWESPRGEVRRMV